MKTNLSLKLFAGLIALSISPVFLACSNERPVNYSGSSKKQGAGSDSEDASGSAKPTKDSNKNNDDQDESDAGTKPKSADGSEKEEASTPLPSPTPVIPNPTPTTTEPVIEAALKAACRPEQVVLIDQNAAATAIFKSAIPDYEDTLADIAQSNCVQMYKATSEFRSFKKLTVTIDSHDGVAYANPGLDRIFFSGNYIKSFANGKSAADIKQEMHGVMVHEINHLYQNFWKDGKYTPLSEGLCDAIRARAGLYPKNRKQKGGNYLGSYTTTGYFILYLDEKYPDFIYKLNKAAKTWNDNFWQQTTGKTVDQLWAEYQASF